MKIARIIPVSFLFVLLCAISSAAAEPFWQWLNPLRQGNTLYGVWGSAENDVFAVGENGTIVHYDGVEWKVTDIGKFPTLYDIWGSSRNDIFAVGANGTIVHFNGIRWASMDSGATEPLRGVWGSSSTDVFAVGYPGIILHYDGVSWSRLYDHMETFLELSSVWGSSATDVFVSGMMWGAQGGMLHYDGVTWSPVATGSFTGFNSMWGSADRHVFASHRDSVVQFDEPEWTEWTDTEVSRFGTKKITGLWGNSANDVYAAGTMIAPYGQMETNSIFHYDGLSWSLQLTGLMEILYDFWGSSGTDVFAVGEGGRIYHYDGVAWILMTGGFFSKSNTPIWGSSDNDLFALASSNMIFHYDGATWAQMSLPNVPSALPPERPNLHYHLKDFWGSSPANVFAVGAVGFLGRDYEDYGVILRYNGVEWTEVYRTISIYRSLIRDIWGASENEVFAVGDAGAVYHFDGSAWRKMKTSVSSDLLSVWGSSGSDVYAVGGGFSGQSNNAILHYDGVAWSTIDTGIITNMPWWNSVWGRSASDVYVASDYGDVLHFNGSEWSLIDIPGMRGWGFKAIWGTENDLFLAKNDGVILHHDGFTWSQMNVGEPAELQAIWGNSANDIFAVGWVDNPTAVHLTSIVFNPDPYPVNPEMHLYHYDGSTWSKMNGGGFYPHHGDMDLWGSAGNDVFAVGGTDKILHYDGSTWRDMSLPSPVLGFEPPPSPRRILHDIWGSSPTNVFSVGTTDGKATILHYDGDTWAETDIGVSGSLSKVRGVSGNDVFATGDAGTFHYDGTGWVQIGGGYNDIWVRSGNDVYALGKMGNREHYDGNEWSQLGMSPAEPSYRHLCYDYKRIWASSEDDVYVIVCSSLYHYDGTEWKNIRDSFPSPVFAYDIWGSSKNDVFVVGYVLGRDGDYNKSSSVMLHYDGRSWSVITGVTFPAEAGLWAGPGNGLYGVGPNGTILFYNREENPYIREESRLVFNPNKWLHDFDQDGRSDIGVYFDQTGTWYVDRSSTGYRELQCGFPGASPVTGDFDGDGTMDYGVYYPPGGMWYLLVSGRGYAEFQFGFAGTSPVVGDFDGDGVTDYGVYDPPTGMWYLMQSAQGYKEKQFGFAGTQPVKGDFDGDGRSDIGVYFDQTGTWYVERSSAGYMEFQCGFPGTIPVTGDFDGDGTMDYGVYDPPTGMWYLLQSWQGYREKQWGFAGTRAIP